MLAEYGGTVPLGIEVRDAAGTLTNASTNTLLIRLPDGTQVTGTTTNPSTGVYACLYVTTQAGLHEWSWITTGPATGQTGAFDVSEQFPGTIVSLDEAKDFLDITTDDEDDLLRAMLEGVTAVVEGGDGRDFPGVGPVVRRTVTTTLRGTRYGTAGFALPHTHIISLTSGAYSSDASAVDLTGYTFADGILRAAYGGYLPSTDWTLTYVVGRASLPANIRMGALEILKLAWNSQRGSDEGVPFLVPYRAQAWLGSEQQVLGFA